MDICRLHLGLYLLANSQGQVLYDIQMIQRKIFPDSKIDIGLLLGILEKNRFFTLEGNPLIIKLLTWPIFSPEALDKQDRYLEKPHHIVTPPKPSQHASIDPNQEKRRQKFRKDKAIRDKGLATFHNPASFTVFSKAWPGNMIGNQYKNALLQWKRLEKSQALPDITIVLQALKEFPPPDRTWPSTWLKKKPWHLIRKNAECRICHGEKIVYGTDSATGKKGALPCPKCQQKNQKPSQTTN